MVCLSLSWFFGLQGWKRRSLYRRFAKRLWGSNAVMAPQVCFRSGTIPMVLYGSRGGAKVSQRGSLRLIACRGVGSIWRRIGASPPSPAFFASSHFRICRNVFLGVSRVRRTHFYGCFVTVGRDGGSVTRFQSISAKSRTLTLLAVCGAGSRGRQAPDLIPLTAVHFAVVSLTARRIGTHRHRRCIISPCPHPLAVCVTLFLGRSAGLILHQDSYATR